MSKSTSGMVYQSLSVKACHAFQGQLVSQLTAFEEVAGHPGHIFAKQVSPQLYFGQLGLAKHIPERLCNEARSFNSNDWAKIAYFKSVQFFQNCLKESIQNNHTRWNLGDGTPKK